jgi:DNA repair exonuclease SbcCD ATPase subunit
MIKSKEELAEDQWTSYVKDKCCCVEHAVKGAFLAGFDSAASKEDEKVKYWNKIHNDRFSTLKDKLARVEEVIRQISKTQHGLDLDEDEEEQEQYWCSTALSYRKRARDYLKSLGDEG